MYITINYNKLHLQAAGAPGKSWGNSHGGLFVSHTERAGPPGWSGWTQRTDTDCQSVPSFCQVD